ncbi:hypothetical protein FS749_000721 [Ceratobasidium sp. UAMH 11750]|nr:hypothetical protein FS749_000721 [Ceratobasidium sp. UAMH 11750]
MAMMNAIWEKRNGPQGELCYVRQMIGSESILDQIHQLQNGHNQFAFGVTFYGELSQAELEARLVRALVRLRYSSPLLSAVPTQNIHDPELRSWVYRPVQSIQQAEGWVNSVLRINASAMRSNPEVELRNLVERPLGPGDIFEVHLVGPYANEGYTLFVYTSHALVEGQAMAALIRQLLSWMTEKDLKVEEVLQQEEAQVRNLHPGAVLSFGGLPERWNEESPAFLKQFELLAGIEKSAHSLKPQRTEITKIGKIVRAQRSLDEQSTARLLKAIKANGVTVTQVLEAAHVVATYALEPLSPSDMAKSHASIFPALVSTRHLRVPPYDRPDEFGNLNTGFTLVFPTELVNFPPRTDLRTQILALARHSRAQYRTFLSSPYIPFVFPAQAEAHPMRAPLGEDPNKYAGEITGLGILDTKIGINWHDGQPKGRPVIEAIDVHLGLRQCNKRTIVHSWTIRRQLKLQVQASDIWDVEYLERFLDEIVKGAMSVCVVDV